VTSIASADAIARIARRIQDFDHFVGAVEDQTLGDLLTARQSVPVWSTRSRLEALDPPNGADAPTKFTMPAVTRAFVATFGCQKRSVTVTA
jgi:hypothetical protein